MYMVINDHFGFDESLLIESTDAVSSLNMTFA